MEPFFMLAGLLILLVLSYTFGYNRGRDDTLRRIGGHRDERR